MRKDGGWITGLVGLLLQEWVDGWVYTAADLISMHVQSSKAKNMRGLQRLTVLPQERDQGMQTSWQVQGTIQAEVGRKGT